MAPPVCPSEPRENDAFKTFARALHVHHAPQPPSSYGAELALPRLHPCTEFDVASSKFTFTGGPHVKTTCLPLARAAGTPLERHPQWILSWCSTRVTCEFGFSGCPRLTPRGARKFLVVLYGAARATCHVPPADSRPAPWSFRRFGASIGATPVPIGPAVRALCPEMLGHTDTLTNTIRPTFFQRPTGGNLRS